MPARPESGRIAIIEFEKVSVPTGDRLCHVDRHGDRGNVGSGELFVPGAAESAAGGLCDPDRRGNRRPEAAGKRVTPVCLRPAYFQKGKTVPMQRQHIREMKWKKQSG